MNRSLELAPSLWLVFADCDWHALISMEILLSFWRWKCMPWFTMSMQEIVRNVVRHLRETLKLSFVSHSKFASVIQEPFRYKRMLMSHLCLPCLCAIPSFCRVLILSISVNSTLQPPNTGALSLWFSILIDCPVQYFSLASHVTRFLNFPYYSLYLAFMWSYNFILPFVNSSCTFVVKASISTTV